MKKVGPPKQSVYCGSTAVGEGEAVAAAPADLRQEVSGRSNGENALMKRTLVAQSRKIQQLTAKIDAMETERETLRQEVPMLTRYFGSRQNSRIRFYTVETTLQRPDASPETNRAAFPTTDFPLASDLIH